jgi:WD40 repeat protein
MSWIFVSHSNRDNGAAANLHARLKGHGYEALFLDFDEHDGIGAGRDWESVLYRRLRHCAAVILLCSEATANSRWCFAEVSRAREYEKPLFALRLTGCTIEPILAGVQAIDWTPGKEEEGFRRLVSGLGAHGVDPRDSFCPDPKRSPYPGMLAYDEADAGVYFGRGPEVRHALRVLEEMRGSSGGSRLAVVTGPSGSGKSSLARAGVIARLKKDPANWSVRPAIVKPGVIPPDLLVEEAPAPDPKGILLFVDQLEEWLMGAQDQASRAFLESLSRVLKAPGTNVLALATLRADLLDGFLKSPLGRILPAPRIIPIAPMPLDRFEQIIEGPAAWADIDFDAGLVQQMIDDTQTEDALPLLAFTLRELFEDCRERHTNTFEYTAYNRLGGIAGAVGNATRGVMAGTALDEHSQIDLRRAFLKLADVQPTGSFIRRTALWAEIPAGAREILEKFIKARLVATGGPEHPDSVWVIHDALFRAWPSLASWLEADRNFKLWRRRVAVEVDEWQGSQNKRLGLLRDEDLSLASKWLADRHDDLDPRESEYIVASARMEAWRRFVQRLLQYSLITALVAACVCAGVAFWFYRDADARRRDALAKKSEADGLRAKSVADKNRADELRKEAERRSRVELASRLASQAVVLDDYEKQLLLAAEAVDVTLSKGEPVVGNAMYNLIYLLSQAHGRRRFRLPLPPLSAALSSRGKRVAAVQVDGSIFVRDWDNKNPILSVGGPPPQLSADPTPETNAALALSEDGKKLAVGGHDGRIRLWEFGGPITESRPLTGGTKPIFDLAFSPDGRHLASGGADGRARVWDLAAPTKDPADVGVDMVHIHSVALSNGGKRLITGGEDGKVRIWELGKSAGQPQHRDFGGDEGGSFAVALSADGRRLVTGKDGWTVEVRDLDAPADKPPLRIKRIGPGPPVISLRIVGERVVAGLVGGVLIWDLSRPGEPIFVLTAAPIPVLAVEPGEDGKRIRSVRGDSTVAELNTEDISRYPEILHGLRGAALSVAVGGRRTVASSVAGQILAWDADKPDAQPEGLNCDQGLVRALALAADGATLFAGTRSGAIVRWDLTKSEPKAAPFFHQPSPVYCLSITPDASHLASGGDNEAWVWNLTKPSDPPRVLAGQSGTVGAVAITPDGKSLATAGEDAKARVWDLTNPSDPPRVFVGHTGPVGCVALTPDGKILATGGIEDNTVRFWDLRQSAASPIVHRNHATGVVSMALARDKSGFRLATASADLLALWDLSTPKADPLPLREGNVSGGGCLAFTSDGSGLVVGGSLEFVRVWNFRPEHLLKLVRYYVGRNLTEAEWQEFLPDTPRRRLFEDLP